MSSDENEGLAIELFQEPIGYYELEKPASYIDYTLTTGQTFHLRLVGHNPLWVQTITLAHHATLSCPN